jgi:hypothetical protein
MLFDTEAEVHAEIIRLRSYQRQYFSTRMLRDPVDPALFGRTKEPSLRFGRDA